MQVVSHFQFDINECSKRINRYLSQAVDAETVEQVPAEKDFTFDNGYYVECCAVFVDIRDSSKLTYEDTKKNVSKIYRSFVSEITAVMQSLKQCKHINIVGDCVSGIFDTSNDKNDLREIFLMIAKIHAIIMMLNQRLKQRDLPTIKVGIGVDYGKTLAVKAGYKGSELNELVWMGKVVNNAAHLCGKANKGDYPIILCSESFYQGLGKATCTRYNTGVVFCTYFLDEKKSDCRGGDFYMVFPSMGIE